MSTETNLHISRRTFRRLLRVIALFLKSAVGFRAKMLLTLLLVFMLCINGMNVVNSFVGRYFMSAIEARDMSGFVRFAWLYAGVFLASTIVAVFFRFSEERLGLLWREWLTQRITAIYMNQRVYLHLDDSSGLSNPDQRITEDVKQLTTTTLSFLLMILNGTMTAISFSGVLWSISPPLFGVAVLYAAVGSALTVLLGRPLIRLNYRQADYEADFRSELIRVKENAEAIALTGNQQSISRRLLTRIDSLAGNFRRITSVNRNLNFFTTGYNYMIQLIPILFVAPLFIHQGVEFGVIGQSAMAFATLVAAFSLVVTQFQAISAYASVVARLGEFMEAAEKAAAHHSASCIASPEGSDHIVLKGLTLLSTEEEGRILVRDLNVALTPGQRVMVYGPNQSARSALFRACACLYDAGTGVIEHPPHEKMAFLPEQPFLSSGTAREVLLFNGAESKVTNADLAALFAELGLVSSKFQSPADFDTVRHWHEDLSFSKQQLMSVARALLASPAFLFFDQFESTLRPETWRRILEALERRGIACIAFGECEPQPGVYHSSLKMEEDGSWEWKDLSPASP